MRDANGEWYPDPPSDPEERARWKTMYFSRNYGASREQVLRYINETPPRPSRWQRFVRWICGR